MNQPTIQTGTLPQNNNGQLQRPQNIGGPQTVYGQLQRPQNTANLFTDAVRQYDDLVSGTNLFPLARIQDAENPPQQSAPFFT
ncbi:21531_t:CDS:1, partial [Dentiscutata erythropus]